MCCSFDQLCNNWSNYIFWKMKPDYPLKKGAVIGEVHGCVGMGSQTHWSLWSVSVRLSDCMHLWARRVMIDRLVAIFYFWRNHVMFLPVNPTIDLEILARKGEDTSVVLLWQLWWDIKTIFLISNHEIIGTNSHFSPSIYRSSLSFVLDFSKRPFHSQNLLLDSNYYIKVTIHFNPQALYFELKMLKVYAI